MSKKRADNLDIATKNYVEAETYIKTHPMFAPLASHAWFQRREGNLCPEQGWAVVTKDGSIHIHSKRRAEVDEWVYVLAHCLLHLGFGHFQDKENKLYWNTACDVYVSKFLYDLKLGKRPDAFGFRIEMPVKTELQLYEHFLEQGIPASLKFHGTAGENASDMIFHSKEQRYAWNRRNIDWEGCFGKGLFMAVTKAVKIAAGQADTLLSRNEVLTNAKKSRNWFIDHYPLLGALASGFELIEDANICQRLDISIAAIDVLEKEIYINPAAGLSEVKRSVNLLSLMSFCMQAYAIMKDAKEEIIICGM